MPKFRPYEQQTVANPRQVSPAAFGAEVGAAMSNMGKAVGQTGDALAEIEYRSQKRSDVINTVRFENDFNQRAANLRQTFVDSEDITSPEAMGKFQSQLRDEMNKTFSGFNGLPESKARLKASLEQAFGQNTQQMLQTHFKAQQTLLLDSVTELSNSLASSASLNPGIMQDSLDELDSRVDSLAPALTPDQEREYRRKGKEDIITSAASGLLQKGDYAGAEMIMNEHSKILSPNVSRRLRIDVAVEKGKALEKEQAYNNRVAQYTLLTQRNLTEEEKQRIALLPDKPSQMTPADKIAEYELVTGKGASQAVVDKFYNVDATAALGGSLRGRSLQMINDNLFSYANGTLSRQEGIEFQSAVMEAYGVKEYTDPVTGERTRSQPSMPPAVRDALEKGAGNYGPMDVGGMNKSPGDAGTTQMDPIEGESLWSMAQDVSGPFTAIERGVFELSGYGDPRVQKAASTATWLQENITHGIKPEGRIANQYREELRDMVKIEPKILRNDMAYMYRLRDMDVNLRSKLKDLQSIVLGDRAASTQERRDALTLSNNIQNALVRLNVTRVKTVEEAKQLPPGSYFVNPQGTILRVPEKASE